MDVDLTVDQVRAIVAVADTGGFTAAAKQLHRVQSAISQSVASAERHLGVRLFERGRRATLTPQGAALMVHARRILADFDGLVGHARDLATGREPEISFVCDAIFPMESLVGLCRVLAEAFPLTPVRIGSETLGAVASKVESGDYRLGVVGPAANLGENIISHAVGSVRMIPVVAPDHPLAEFDGPIPDEEVRRHVQVVLSSRGSEVPDVAVLGERTWRVADLNTKKALMTAGLGWGNLPEPMVRCDLQMGRLKTIALQAWGPDAHTLTLSAIHRRDCPPGEIGRFVLDRLPELCGLNES